jgi:hypothetical protein
MPVLGFALSGFRVADEPWISGEEWIMSRQQSLAAFSVLNAIRAATG